MSFTSPRKIYGLGWTTSKIQSEILQLQNLFPHRQSAKFWLDPDALLAVNYGFRRKELRDIERTIFAVMVNRIEFHEFPRIKFQNSCKFALIRCKIS